MKAKCVLILICLFLLLGCNTIYIGRQSLKNYKGWVIIGKYQSAYNGVNIENPNTGEIIDVDTYDYYWHHYNLGDTIK